MKYELVDRDLNPLPPFLTLQALGDWLMFFAGKGVDLHCYVFDPEGNWGWGRETLAERGHSDAVIGMILQTGEDEFHEAATMQADLKRCEEILCRDDGDGSSRVRILKEIRAMMEGCEIAISKGLQVQILALEMDEEDEDEDEDDEDDD